MKLSVMKFNREQAKLKQREAERTDCKESTRKSELVPGLNCWESEDEN